MEKIVDHKKDCTGCCSCLNACPTKAITMEYDSEGFRYPVIDKQKCINCNKCVNVCHMIHRKESNNYKIPICYAGYLKNMQELTQVSSGGAFWALAQEVIRREGIVYGAVHHSIFDIRHERADTIKKAELFRRSKYLQSYIGETFRLVKTDLESGKEVLFSGTPCQVAGLYSFLGKDYAKLYTCEVICHGVPSMKAFHKYIEMIEEERHAKAVHIIYRDKSKGWSNNQIEIKFEHGALIREPSVEHKFHKGYLKGIYYRPSCNSCPYAKLPRTSDISLADFWQYTGKLKKSNNNLGISLVICSNEKGIELFKSAGKYMVLEDINLRDAVMSCYHLTHAPIVSEKKRRKFFRLLDERGFKIAIEESLKDTVVKKCGRKLLKLIDKCVSTLKRKNG